MIRNIKIFTSFFYIKSVFFFLSIFFLHVNADTKVITQEGDTLLKLSKQYGVSLKELMHKNNYIDANRKLEGEVIIIPLNNNERESKQLSYKVTEGDTLYKIARDYNVNIKDILSINNLENSSLLKANQIILLPYGAVYKKNVNQTSTKFANIKVFYHQTSSSESINTIAKIHKISIEDISNLNKLNYPTIVNPNTKLKIRKNKPFRWLKYGPLVINWSGWTYLDGYYISEAKNKKNKSFYLAISCEKRILNNTLNNSNWTSWYFPKSDFEFKLINNFCEQDLNL